MICLVQREAKLHPTFDVVVLLLRMIANSNRNSVKLIFNLYFTSGEMKQAQSC